MLAARDGPAPAAWAPAHTAPRQAPRYRTQAAGNFPGDTPAAEGMGELAPTMPAALGLLAANTAEVRTAVGTVPAAGRDTDLDTANIAAAAAPCGRVDTPPARSPAVDLAALAEAAGMAPPLRSLAVAPGWRPAAEAAAAAVVDRVRAAAGKSRRPPPAAGWPARRAANRLPVACKNWSPGVLGCCSPSLRVRKRGGREMDGAGAREGVAGHFFSFCS
jgi:hypothetical protein